MTISLRLLESQQQFDAKVNAAILTHLNKKIDSNKGRVTKRFKQAIETWIRSQPEIASLLDEGVLNSLNAQFGLRLGTATGAVDDIVSAVVDSSEIVISKITPRLRGGIEFRFQPNDFGNLLSLDSGHVTTENNTDLHWLNWLLTLGDTIIIVGYKYTPENQGRSRGGVMDTGGSFRVSPNFSGTASDNFITRALANREQEISTLLSGLFNG